MLLSKNAINTNSKILRRLALLVNDDLLAESVFVHMQKKGFHVDTYYDFEGFEEKIKNAKMRPDLLVFDMDIFDFSAFQSVPENKNIKLIAMSSNHDMDSRLKAVRAHVSCFITKPVNIEKLATQINESLSLKKRRIHSILIIDDSAFDLKLYQHLLEPQGIRLRFVQDPLNTLTELEHHKPDLVLSDYNMPQANGLDILRVIRQVYSQSELPVLFVTGTDDPEILFEIIKETNLKPIHKPLSHDDFLARIYDVLE